MTWRWTLYVNIAFAAVAFAVGCVAIAPTVRERGVKLDVPGAILATVGFFALVFGFMNAEGHGFASVGTWGFLADGVVLLGSFVLLQRKGKSPLLPLRIVVHRDRGASLIAIFVSGAVIFGVNLYLVCYLQIVLGFAPLQTGLAVLPLCLGIMASAMVSTSALLPKPGAKVLVPSGMPISAVGALLLMLAKAGSNHFLHVAVPMFVVAVGLGAIISSALSVGTLGVDMHHAGTASAAVSTVANRSKDTCISRRRPTVSAIRPPNFSPKAAPSSRQLTTTEDSPGVSFRCAVMRIKEWTRYRPSRREV